MNREIKFRGKRIDNGKWVYGLYIISANWRDEEDPISIISEWNGEHSVSYEVEPETVGQYTGVKDKKGVEIYEDDIVKQPGWRGATYIRLVEWQQVSASDDAGLDMVGFENFQYSKVIGNGHDNPRLLKKTFNNG